MENLPSDEKKRRMRTLCSAIIRDNEKVLLIRRNDHNVWELPGGGIEFSETPEETVKREVKEETDLEIEPKNVVGVVSVSFESDKDGVIEESHLTIIVYECDLKSDKDVKLSQSHNEHKWVEIKDMENMDNLALGMNDIIGIIKN